MIKRRNRKNLAQGILEYTILIAVVSAAFIAMYVYFQRAVNSRMEDLRQEYNPSAP